MSQFLIKKHLLPVPRLKEAELIADSMFATSMIDSSDGLSASLKFIAQESKVGADVYLDKVPVSKQLEELSKRGKKIDIFDFVLNGGEDYELVYTIKKGKFDNFKKLMPKARKIGIITATKGIRYYLDGKLKKESKQGFQHFK